LVTFVKHVHEYEDTIRKLKVSHDKLINRVAAAENFTDKYVPIMAQNVRVYPLIF